VARARATDIHRGEPNMDVDGVEQPRAPRRAGGRPALSGSLISLDEGTTRTSRRSTGHTVRDLVLVRVAGVGSPGSTNARALAGGGEPGSGSAQQGRGVSDWFGGELRSASEYQPGCDRSRGKAAARRDGALHCPEPAQARRGKLATSDLSRLGASGQRTGRGRPGGPCRRPTSLYVGSPSLCDDWPVIETSKHPPPADEARWPPRRRPDGRVS